MGKLRRHGGFSLIEVLLALGTLAIGMVFIGGTYLVGIHFSGVSAERTTATVVANEAFSKIRIFPNPGTWSTSSQRFFYIDPNEFAYPSERTVYPYTGALADRQYFWSALGRRNPNDPTGRSLIATVFVSRRIRGSTMYWDRNLSSWPVLIKIPYPKAVYVEVTHNPSVHTPYEVSIIDLDPSDPIDEVTFINNGYAILENTTGRIYRVLKRHSDRPDTLLLDRPWNPEGTYPDPDGVWVVPPPVGRGKGPCIEVYQKEIPF